MQKKCKVLITLISLIAFFTILCLAVFNKDNGEMHLSLDDMKYNGEYQY